MEPSLAPSLTHILSTKTRAVTCVGVTAGPGNYSQLLVNEDSLNVLLFLIHEQPYGRYDFTDILKKPAGLSEFFSASLKKYSKVF
jgi:hypothetical protein